MRLIPFFFLCLSIGLPKSDARPPNVIFIMIDDQGYYDLGCYGATEVKTPRIDQMATEGIRFTDYYAAAPICSPSRAGLLTGCYPRRIGMETWVQRADSKRGIHPDELTMGELFQQNGYATACIGKWHLGHEEPFLPNNQGFDHYFGLLHNLDPVEMVYFKGRDGPAIWQNNQIIKANADPAELTQIYTNETLNFIEKNRDTPFFIYLPHTMLHKPLGVSEAFRGSSEWGEYGDAIQELDHHVGRIFDALTAFEIADETIVVYASDNGRGPGRTEDQPLTGRKLTTWEAGIRVPCILWGPGFNIPTNRTWGKVVSALDWLPTLASFSGLHLPENLVIDGRDLSHHFSDETVEPINTSVANRRSWAPPGEWKDLVSREEYQDAFFIHGSHGALAAVRWDRWKLVLNPQLALYNLESDPGETTPVKGSKDLLRKLRGMAVLFQEEMSLEAREPGIIR